MSIWNEFWADEQGAIISAELAAVATVAVIGTTVGLSTVSKSVNSELQEIAVSIRSLNQSYSVPGHAGCQAWTAGSSYTQPDVNQSIHDLLGDSVEAEKAKSGAKADQPNKKKRKNEDKKKEQKNEQKQDNNDQEQSALPQSTDGKTAVEEVDDESQVEVVIEPRSDV